MKVFFKNSKGEEILLKEVDSIKEVNKVVDNFLKEHNYKSYYCRVMGLENKDGVMFDVGSYTEFFIVRGENVYENYFGKEED